MKISLIIVVYNLEKYILKCLNSILEQSYYNIEIIVIDDGSTDNSLEIIKKKSTLDNRIKYFSQPNAGVCEARRKGYELATGDYLWFIDGDDWIKENSINEIIYHVTENKPNILLLEATKIWENGLEKSYNPFPERLLNSEVDYLKELFLMNISVNIWDKVVKKSFLDSLEEPLVRSLSYAEDFATIVYWFCNTNKIQLLKKELYCYYQRENSAVSEYSEKIFDVFDALDNIKQNLKNYKKYDKYLDLYEYAIYLHIYEYKVLAKEPRNKLHKRLYLKYLEYNVNLSNFYIVQRYRELPLSTKIRIKLYSKNYQLATKYDFIRNSVKNIIGRV